MAWSAFVLVQIEFEHPVVPIYRRIEWELSRVTYLENNLGMYLFRERLLVQLRTYVTLEMDRRVKYFWKDIQK